MANLNNPFSLSGDYFSSVGAKNNPFNVQISAADTLAGKPMNIDSNKPTMGMPQAPKQQPLTPDPVAATFTTPKQADGTFGALGGGTKPIQIGMPAVTQGTVPAQVPGQIGDIGAPSVTPGPQQSGLAPSQQPSYQTRPVQTDATPPGLIAGAMSPAQNQESKIEQQQVANATLTPLQASANKFQTQAQLRNA